MLSPQSGLAAPGGMEGSSQGLRALALMGANQDLHGVQIRPTQRDQRGGTSSHQWAPVPSLIDKVSVGDLPNCSSPAASLTDSPEPQQVPFVKTRNCFF